MLGSDGSCTDLKRQCSFNMITIDLMLCAAEKKMSEDVNVKFSMFRLRQPMRRVKLMLRRRLTFLVETLYPLI